MELIRQNLSFPGSLCGQREPDILRQIEVVHLSFLRPSFHDPDPSPFDLGLLKEVDAEPGRGKGRQREGMPAQGEFFMTRIR